MTHHVLPTEGDISAACDFEFDMGTTGRLFAALKAGLRPPCPRCNDPDSLKLKDDGGGFEIRGAKSWNIRCTKPRCPKHRNFRELADGQLVP